MKSDNLEKPLMMKRTVSLFALFSMAAVAMAQTITVLYTTDVHGAIFQYDFAQNREVKNSMSQTYQYVKSVRDTTDNVILLDNGDYLQGTPATYFYNYVNTVSTHIVAAAYNFMKVDAVSVGNHDIEAGHDVYDNIRKQFNMPMLSANIVDKKTGEPYFTPYIVIDRGGKKIAVIGLTTPHIPHWLPEYLWEGMEFEDMVECAAKWIKIVKEKETPDVIIGMFHAGYDYTYGNQTADTYRNENASVLVAERVSGFDAILMGHDHKLYNAKVKNPEGKDVVVIDAGTASRNIGQLTITFDANGTPQVDSKVVSLTNTKASAEFDSQFSVQQKALVTYTQKVLGTVDVNINSADALFGNSAFVDIVHETMLKYSKADISLSAPLLLGVTIPKGDLKIGQMFNIYRYENMLNVMTLTGEEIKKYLEYSYNLWVSNPSETGHLLNVNNRGRLEKNYYNFDSAAGIIYTVNPFKPYGERVEISSMANGTPFDMTKIYKVAVNSYRYNGGGGHLEQGLGLTKDQIAERLVESVRRDLRGILIDDIQESGHIGRKPLNNWKFVPEKDLRDVISKDYDMISNSRQYK